MSYDWLTKPISEEEPCGPDLDATDDDAFLDYVFGAEDKFPERYFTPGLKKDGEGTDDQLFDPRSIDIAAEKAQIDTLLARTRDVRLLVMLARFQVLAGRLTGFADVLAAIAGLLETFPLDVHPVARESTSARRSALEELTDQVTVIVALQYMPLGGVNAVTHRQFLVADGRFEARKGEEDLNRSSLLSVLADPGNSEDVERAMADLGRAAEALHRIRKACLANDPPFTVALDKTVQSVAEMQDLIHAARSDLSTWSEADNAPSEDAPEEVAGDAAGADAVPIAAAPAPPPLPTGTFAVANHRQARATLEEVERYFAETEPSSAALLLTTQARLLIGKSLIEAMETLMPQHAARAVIAFGGDNGFSLSMEQLKSLSAAGTRPREVEAASAERGETARPKVEHRADAAKALEAVEGFFRHQEPGSPIPVLLTRARGYLDRNFESIISEILPSQTSD